MSLQIPKDATWIGLVKGALSELIYAYRFEQFGALTPEETASIFRDMYDEFVFSECAAMAGSSCCYDNVQYRFTENGQLQQSVNGGDWVSSVNDPRIAVPQLPTPDMSAEGAQCVVAKNMAFQLLNNVININNQRAEGSTIAEIAAVALEVLFVLLNVTIVGAILSPLLLLIAAELLKHTAEDIGAYVDDSSVEDAVVCAIYCSLEINGQLTDQGYYQMLGRLFSGLPAGEGKQFVYDCARAVGRQQFNNYASMTGNDGTFAGVDCVDCACTTFCDYSQWTIHDARGTIVHQETAYIEVSAVQNSNGKWWVDVVSPDINTGCCFIDFDMIGENVFIETGWYCPTTLDNSNDANLGFSYTGSRSANRFGLASQVRDTGFTVKIYSTGDCA